MLQIFRLSLSFPLIIGFLLLLLSFWLKQKLEYGINQQSSKKTHSIERYVNNLQASRLNEQGNTEYTLNADKLYRYDDEVWQYIEKPRFTYFSPTEYTVITSEKARTDDYRQKVEMLERVTIFSERANAETLSIVTSNLLVFPNAKRVISNERIVGKLGESSISANALFADQNSGTMLLSGRVSGEYKIGTK